MPPLPTTQTTPPPEEGQDHTAGLVATALAAGGAVGYGIAGLTPAAAQTAALYGGARLTAEAAEEILERIIKAHKLHFRGRGKRQLAKLKTELGDAYPERAPAEIDDLARKELGFEKEFQRKMLERLARDLPKALAIPDADERRAAVEAILRREARYLAMREEAMTDRAVARTERLAARDASPAGAYWHLSPFVKEHTPDCVALAGKFWPWEFLDEVAPPLHHGCRCQLLTLKDAVERGYMTLDQIGDAAEMTKLGKKLLRDANTLKETVSLEEWQAWLGELADLEEAPWERRWSKGTEHGGQFRPRRGGVSRPLSKLKRALLHDLAPELPSTPARSRKERRGKRRRIADRDVFVPEHRPFRRVAGGVAYTSPPGTSEVFAEPAPAGEPDNLPPLLGRPTPAVLNGLSPHRQRRGDEARRRVQVALLERSPDVPPAAAGDHAMPQLEALEEAGFIQTGFEGHGDQRRLVFAGPDGSSRLAVGIDAGGRVSTAEWEPVDPPAPPPELDRHARTWEEFAADLEGFARRTAVEAGHHALLREIVHDTSREADGSLRFSDHAGELDASGTMHLGADTRMDVLAAAATRARGGELTDDQKQSLYATTASSHHEALHAAAPIPPRLLDELHHQWLDEALTEELAHVEAVRALRRQGQQDVLDWAADNPHSPKRIGAYVPQRAALGRILDRAGVPPEDRERFVRRLLLETRPADRLDVIGRTVAHRTGNDPDREAELAARDLRETSGHIQAGATVGGYRPVLAPDLHPTGRPSGLIVDGEAVQAGDRVTTADGPGTVLALTPGPVWTAMVAHDTGDVDLALAPSEIHRAEHTPARPAGSAAPTAGGVAEGDSIDWGTGRGRAVRFLRGDDDWLLEARTDQGHPVVLTPASAPGLRPADPGHREGEVRVSGGTARAPTLEARAAAARRFDMPPGVELVPADGLVATDHPARRPRWPDAGAAPLRVAPREDGRWDVTSGNDSLHLAREEGLDWVPVERERVARPAPDPSDPATAAALHDLGLAPAPRGRPAATRSPREVAASVEGLLRARRAHVDHLADDLGLGPSDADVGTIEGLELGRKMVLQGARDEDLLRAALARGPRRGGTDWNEGFQTGMRAAALELAVPKRPGLFAGAMPARARPATPDLLAQFRFKDDRFPAGKGSISAWRIGRTRPTMAAYAEATGITEEEDEYAGHLDYRVAGGRVWLANATVRPDDLRTGVATALLDELHRRTGMPLVHGDFMSPAGIQLAFEGAARYPDRQLVWLGGDRTFLEFAAGEPGEPVFWDPASGPPDWRSPTFRLDPSRRQRGYSYRMKKAEIVGAVEAGIAAAGELASRATPGIPEVRAEDDFLGDPFPRPTGAPTPGGSGLPAGMDMAVGPQVIGEVFSPDHYRVTARWRGDELGRMTVFFGRVTGLVVREDVRRRGIASALLERAREVGPVEHDDEEMRTPMGDAFARGRPTPGDAPTLPPGSGGRNPWDKGPREQPELVGEEGPEERLSWAARVSAWLRGEREEPTLEGWEKKAYQAPPADVWDDHGTVKLMGAAGGSNGARFAEAKDGTRWLVKAYRGHRDKVATELLANAVYRRMGVKVPEAGTLQFGGKPALAYPLLDGEVRRWEGEDETLAEGFMVDALVANWDVVGLEMDNVLWSPEGEPFRVDQGGTFEFRAQGSPKPYGPVPSEVWTMAGPLGQAFGTMALTPEGKRAGAARIAATLDDDAVDGLADAAPFEDGAMRERVRAMLKARVAWMGRYADGDGDGAGAGQGRRGEVGARGGAEGAGAVPGAGDRGRRVRARVLGDGELAAAEGAAREGAPGGEVRGARARLAARPPADAGGHARVLRGAGGLGGDAGPGGAREGLPERGAGRGLGAGVRRGGRRGGGAGGAGRGGGAAAVRPGAGAAGEAAAAGGRARAGAAVPGRRGDGGA